MELNHSMTIRVLICEGACNPSVHRIDQAVEQQMAQTRSLSVHLKDQQRHLSYTAHLEQAGHHARCLRCGAPRRFGA